MTRNPDFRPQSRAVALEPRILFDGAAAVAVDQQNSPDSAPHAPAPAAEAAPRTLAVIDTRIDNYQALASQAAPGADIVLVGAGQDGLKAISDALAAGGKVASIQILSHGAAGQFTLGSQTISADNIAALSDTLGAWAPQLTGDADILLYGCGVGAGDAGRTLITALAAATGADVAASTNDTGSAKAGGDWALEVSTGAIETGLAAMSYDGLLADASPTVALSTAAIDTLLGGQFSFTASFTNSSSQVGFAPYIDLILPATGKDGAGTEIDDGITFVSATYLGQTVKSYVLTFDAAGNATHPLAKDNTGAAVIVNAATYGAQAGDQLVVLELPYASVSLGQPAIPVVVTAQLSNLADTQGSPDLTIKARGGFQFGNDSANNPTVDPSLIEAGTHSLVVHPTVVTLTSSVNTPEGETATGPNFERTITVTATPAPGQTLTDVDVTQTLPDAIRVTAITGGTVTRLVLANGNIVDTPAEIAAALAQKPFLSSYTVHYATLSAASTTTVSFFVAENDSTGNPVLDPITGDDRTITVGAPTASGQWLPLDPRDQTIPIDPNTGLPTPPAVPETITGTGNPGSFVAKSITLQKSLAIASNVGSPGLSPDDTLQYTLEINLSDYFGMGKTLFGNGEFKIDDALGDGQRLTGTPTLTIYRLGQTFVVPLVVTAGAPGASGTALSFDIAQSLLNDNRIFGGALWGDLSLEDRQQGATRAVITYQSTVAQAYTASYPQSEINEGDSIGNSATVSATILRNPIIGVGGSETDNSAASLTVPTNTIQTSIVTVNGAAPSGSVELKPGDIVTFRMSYDLTTGDYENFSLTSYLPLPLFDLTGLPLTQGTGIGQWTYGAGNTNPDLVDAVTVNTGNSLLFNFGSYVNAGTAGSKVVVDFTLQVGNQPFADQRALTVLAQSDQLTTIPTQQHLVSSGVVNIASVAEPVLAIKHGVVSVGAGSGGLVSGTTGTWAAAGSSGAPFTGSVTDLTAIDGNVTNIDAGDLVRLATAIENTGGLGAFDVTTTVTLPAGLAFVGGSLASANALIYRGDGTALVLGTDYSISGNTIFFLDNGGPSLLPGRAGTANDTSGANVVVITYDVVAAATVAASQNFETSAALTNYSSTNGGPDFTPVDLTDKATQAIAAPLVIKVFAGGTLDDGDSSSLGTTGADLVIGESMLYDIVVTLPEGVTQTLRLDDLIPAGLQLDTGFGTGGYQLITTVAGSAALTADFAGSVAVSGIAATPSGTLGADGVDARLTFSAASASGDNVTTNNSFVLRVRLIAGNVSGNQAGANRSNSAQLVYNDPDGDPPPATPAPVDRTVALSGSQPNIVVREPTVQLTQTAVTSSGNPGQVDAGDTVTYTITIRNAAGGSDFPAYDISFSDALPSELDSIVLQSVVYAGGATNNGGSDFILSGRNLTTAAGANIDIRRGGSITLTVTAIANSTVANVFSFTNTPEARWTSLDGTDPNERTGADGLLNGGSLNDYRQIAPLAIEVVSGSSISHVGGLPDTPLPSPTTEDDQTVAVGEIIRYRVAFVLAEGSTTGATIKIALPDGLSFINDPGTTTIGLVSNSAITNAVDLTTGADPDVTGVSITNRSQALLASDLSNTMTAVVNSTRINTGNPREIVVSLGDLTNSDSDTDREAIYLDFNVRVDNTTAVDTSKSLVSSAKLFSGGGATFLDKTSTIAENVVEPTVSNLTKTVTAFDPRPSQTTGIATVSVDFTNSGDGVGYDFQLTDGGFVSGTNYTVTAVIINGTSYAPGSLPAGVTAAGGTGIIVDFDRLAQGTTVRVVYTVEVSNSVSIASTDATLKWSSLPESFTTYAGSTVGADATASGERDGSGITTAPNTYFRTEGAGLGIIQGTLWDDTASATASTTPDGPGFSGQTVTLTWAGADGNLATTGDNLTFTTSTDSSGAYHFGVLPAGNFRIDTPTTVLAYPFPGDTDDAKVRIDSDGAPLATITISGLGEGSTAAANAGYVRVNDAPVNTLPAAPTTLEDTSLAITGISVADVDAGSLPMTVKLSVLHGTLNLNTVGVTMDSGALNSASITIKGSQSALNTALATLVYTPTLNYNGTDTLTVLTNDLGNLGDANGDLQVNSADALTDTDRLTINITPVNDAPQAVADAGPALEAGGSFNNEAGIPAFGNVLRNDTDVDLNDNPSTEVLSVTLITLGTGTPATTVTPGGTNVIGAYGTLTIQSNGEAEYVVDENNPAVEALRLYNQTLSETFTYRMSDLAGLTSDATITVTIHGRNDTPVGVDDDGTVYEAGGIANGTPGGIDSFPNVLANDTDVDSVANGETKAVTGIRARPEADPGGVMTGVPAGGSATVAGTYGSLTMNSDGTYTYVVDQNATAVQRLAAGDTLIEYFSYLVTDAEGLTDIAQIRITIRGANDNPVASDDIATAQAQTIAGGTVSGGTVIGGNEQGAELNPTGNVITIASRPAGDPSAGNGIDNDVDRTDDPNTLLVVSAIRTGTETGSGTAGTVGSALAGSYGTLTLNADGSYSYDVDSRNAAVYQLAAGATLTDTFTYTLRDTAGLTDTAQITITVYGVNDPPVAADVFPVAIEAGGLANGTPGTNPSGDALANDFDPDGDPIAVTAIRTGPESGIGTAGSVGAPLAGTYGTLTINADGTFTYVVDNANPLVEALRTSGNTLTDTFTYTISDNASPRETDRAQIVVTIRGANDNPVAVLDTATAVEAGGLNNAIAGTNPTGNVLSNDTDVDTYGETKTVTAISGVAAGTVNGNTAGSYGTLTLNANGSYTFLVDNSNAAVQALRSTANTLTDIFTYTVTDALGATSSTTLTIAIQGANDTPVAANDTASALEAGGIANATPGTNPTGNVLTNDSDVDSVANGETKTVTAFANSASVAGTLGSSLAGTYGSLTINADGSFAYVVDNANAVVQGLRTSADALAESFTYTMRDTAGATSTATLTVTIRGANDNPVAIDDAGTAVEAGGTNNGTPGSDATGDVLFNDTDVDNVAYGETKTVIALRTGSESGAGNAGTVGAALAGTYGTLTLNANGLYSYVVDNANAAVQALRTSADTLSETFTYTMRDAAGATDVAQLTITLRGANDAPVARNDFAVAWPPVVGSPGSGRDPTGNVLPNDSDVDAGDSKAVSAIRAGDEASGGALTAVASGTTSGSGERINGTWGWLNIGADGSYLYEVDFLRTAGLAPGAVVQDFFTYELKDAGGLTDLAQLTVFIRGRNNPPIALPVFADAVEAGGIANGTLGIDPTGNALLNDVDLEGDPLTLTAIRTGPESGSGTTGSVGAPLAGTYGTLTINADGTFTYVVDNANPLVEALRTSGNTLTDTFTYTVADIYGASDQATITVTILGANDNPVAVADAGTAVEAGGAANTTPGSTATGNVLANDSDVDAYGETRSVATVSGAGAGTVNGQTPGNFGTLILNADGSYAYVVDDANPAVETLRTPAETLTDTFTYQVVDALGAPAMTTLTITIQGANDNPVASDDTGAATDAAGPPVTTGNVLPNDSDIDGGDSKTVVAVRTGAETGTGSAGSVGARLQGKYGTLLLNADGSWRYEVDTTNQDVLNAAGAGKVLSDVFTYTMSDTAGATDQAQLVITLDMVAPYTDTGTSPFFSRETEAGGRSIPLPNVEPITFIHQVVSAIDRQLRLSNTRNDGTDITQEAPLEIRSISLGAGLGLDPDQFVGRAVQQSRLVSKLDSLQVEARQGVVSLSADGLLADPSVFVPDPRLMIEAAPAPRDRLVLRTSSAPSFHEQLKLAAQRFRPVTLNSHPARIPGETHQIS